MEVACTQPKGSDEKSAMLMRHQTSVAAWYLPLDSNDESCADLVKATYEKAIQFHKAHFKSSEANTWLSKKPSISDVFEVLSEARSRYETKKGSRSKVVSGAISCWKLASSRLMQYKQVIDTIMSVDQQHTALIWGAMRFLFTITLNHEEMSVKIAYAIAEIGAALPEMEFIAHKLYPVKHMQQTLVNIYAQLIEFFIRATRWYEDVQRSNFKKIVRSILKPWPLEFEDIRMNIDSSIRRLREQSFIAQQAEMRDVHVKIDELRSLAFRDQFIQMAFGNESSPLQSSLTSAGTSPFVREKVSLYLSDVPFNAQDTLQNLRKMKHRRRARGAFQQPKIWSSSELQEWLSTDNSSVVLLQGSGFRSEESRDIALDMIDLLQSEAIPVVWYLAPSSFVSDKALSASDMIRLWIRQILDQILETSSQLNISDARIQACKSFGDWLGLFIEVLAHIPLLVIILDAYGETFNFLDIISQFLKVAQDQNCTTKIKIMALAYVDTGDSSPDLPLTSKATYAKTNLSSHLAARSSRALSKKQLRRGTIRLDASSGPESVRPLVRQLIFSSDIQKKS